MKGFDWTMVNAVLNEMLGIWLWVLLALGLFAVLGFLFFWIKRGGLSSRRLVPSELLGLFVTGPLALVIMATVSSSGYTDAKVPIDWLLVGLVYGIGVVMGTMLIYTLWSILARPKAAE